MKTLNLKSKDIVSAMRFDGSYHISEGTIFLKKLKRMPHADLISFCPNIFTAGRNKRVYTDKEKGFPYLSNSDVVKNNPFESCNYNSKKYGFDKTAFLKEGMILTGRVGAIGQTSYVTKEFEENQAMGSDNIIRIVAKDKKMSGYIYAFLVSKYGNALFNRLAAGGVQPYISEAMLQDIPIPILPEETQQKIHNLIANASQLRVEANKLLKEAMEIFENYDVDGFTKIFKKKVSTLGFSWASYNNNVECDKIENSISEFLKIGDVATKCFAPPLFKHIYLDKDNGHPFLTGAELTKFNKKYYRWLSPRGVKNIEDYKVKKGTLLLYKSGTTDGGILGNVFIADDILDGACLSDHVIRIFTEDIKMSYWMFAFFKSRAGVKLLQKTATGSMIPFITPDRLQELKFPKPDDNFAFVTNNIEKYLEKTVQSQLSENQAIDLIEKEIDQWQQL